MLLCSQVFDLLILPLHLSSIDADIYRRCVYVVADISQNIIPFIPLPQPIGLAIGTSDLGLPNIEHVNFQSPSYRESCQSCQDVLCSCDALNLQKCKQSINQRSNQGALTR